MARTHVRLADLERDPTFPRRYSVHRTSGNIAEVLEHITVSETELAPRLAEIVTRRGELVRATPVRVTARDVATWLAKAGGRAPLLVVVFALAVACGRSPSTAPSAAPPAGPCSAVRFVPLADGSVVLLRVYYTICPTDSTLNAMGWTRVP